MSVKRQCDMCMGLFAEKGTLNVVSFFERNQDSIGLLKQANPRLELCDDCFSFMKKVVKQAQFVTIDDIEKED